jgi:hypothetical protein
VTDREHPSLIVIDDVVQVDRWLTNPLPAIALKPLPAGVRVGYRGTAYRPDGPSSYDLILGRKP